MSGLYKREEDEAYLEYIKHGNGGVFCYKWIERFVSDDRNADQLRGMCLVLSSMMEIYAGEYEDEIRELREQVATLQSEVL